MKIKQQCILCGHMAEYEQKGPVLKAQPCPKCGIPMRLLVDKYEEEVQNG